MEIGVLLIQSGNLSIPFSYPSGERFVVAAIHNRRAVGLQTIP